MELVISSDGKTFRFAKAGDTMKEGEKQLFYRLGPNGGFIFDEGPPVESPSRMQQLDPDDDEQD